MKLTQMTLNIVLLWSVLASLPSCNGQVTTHNQSNHLMSEISMGDTVNETGDSLWYIYQDTKNNYWFGSNGEGVFRYDGKTILNFTTKNGLCSDSIRQIQEDEFGNIYFSTMNGINKYDGQKIYHFESRSKVITGNRKQMICGFICLEKRKNMVPIATMGKNFTIWSFQNITCTMNFLKEASIRFLVLMKYTAFTKTVKELSGLALPFLVPAVLMVNQ